MSSLHTTVGQVHDVITTVGHVHDVITTVGQVQDVITTVGQVQDVITTVGRVQDIITTVHPYQMSEFLQKYCNGHSLSVYTYSSEEANLYPAIRV